MGQRMSHEGVPPFPFISWLPNFSGNSISSTIAGCRTEQATLVGLTPFPFTLSSARDRGN